MTGSSRPRYTLSVIFVQVLMKALSLIDTAIETEFIEAHLPQLQIPSPFRFAMPMFL
jgi:hypothetical protein